MLRRCSELRAQVEQHAARFTPIARVEEADVAVVGLVEQVGDRHAHAQVVVDAVAAHKVEQHVAALAHLAGGRDRRAAGGEATGGNGLHLVDLALYADTSAQRPLAMGPGGVEAGQVHRAGAGEAAAIGVAAVAVGVAAGHAPVVVDRTGDFELTALA
ncbi:hypothetical protein G6F22_020143 [Rhizopus arrhizus]|nr:hypothetical protein G6F22_020143 [Rhizopus arrhizus]